MGMTLVFVLAVVVLAIFGVIAVLAMGGHIAFAVPIAGIATAAVCALFKHWPFK